MRRRRQLEVISGRVNSTGAIAAGEGFTIQRTGAGQYIITFEKGFRFLSATGNGFQTGIVVTFANPGKNIVFVTTAALTTGTVTDAAWSFDAKGYMQ